MYRVHDLIGQGQGMMCHRLLMTVTFLFTLNGRGFADCGYGEDIDYTMAILNASYPGRLDRPAELGKFSEGYVGAASGLLVHVQSENSTTDHACSLPLRSVNGEPLPHAGEPWIALIRRGQCGYSQKVENAYKSNASAVLIFNDRDSPILQKMKIATYREISAVFTYLWKGEALAQRVDNGTRVMLSIEKGNSCFRPYSSLNRTSVLFVSISFIVLMVISLTWLVFYYIQRFRYFHAKDRLARRLCSAAKKALSKIPTKNIRSEDKELQGDGECCAVCIEPYRISDILRILPCRHEFHKTCIDPWLLEHRTCPMCKMDILKFYGYNFAGSQESILQVDIEDGGLGDSESVSTTPSPEPPPDFSTGGARGSVGSITVSTSTPYGHLDPQVAVFNGVLNQSNPAQTAAYDSVYLAACARETSETNIPCAAEIKQENFNKAKKMTLEKENVTLQTTDQKSTGMNETNAEVNSKEVKVEVSGISGTNGKCLCPCSCNNSLVTPSSLVTSPCETNFSLMPRQVTESQQNSSVLGQDTSDSLATSIETSPRKQRRKGKDEHS